jgi:Leucine-rich repeat (LRR) protein
MKQKRSNSAPKRGMARDKNSSDLQNTEYAIAVNMTSSNESGDVLNMQLEPSNYKGVVFPPTYKVIGEKVNLLLNRTYFFLTSITEDQNSDDYKRSSIGYVDNTSMYNINYNNEEETDLNEDCNSCGYKAFNPLTTPLESITQVPSLQYVELVNDKCLSVFEGLNFDINFPAKKIEINQEKLGTTLYWNDYRNPPRFLNVTNLEEKGTQNYLFEINDPCEDISYSTCIDVDKLLILPKYNRIVLEPSEQQIGGNLKKGTYEFWGAYCDLTGNEMTQYSTPTNPISIFDENSNIMSQTETDEFTNFAIKIKVHNLDTRHFKYYKIAVVERNNVVNTQSVFVAGIYPTTDDTVVYTHSGSSNDDLYIARGNVSIKKRMDFNTLNAIKPNWEKAKFTMVSGDVLWHGGLVQEEELNIQPVMNLFGGLLHWQTSAASENLYKNSIANSKYKAYPRDEIQPFGIRLLYTDGGYSATIPLIGRPKRVGEGDILVSDTNLNSVINNSSLCITTERNKKWQIYNTASAYDELCTDIEDSATSIDEDITKTCVLEAVENITANSVTIQITDEFINLETYVKDNPNDTDIAIITNALIPDYPGDCTPTYVGDCGSPFLQNEYNVIGEIDNEVDTFVQKLVSDYLPSIPPATCAKYKRTVDVVSYIEDEDFMNNFMTCVAGTPKKVYVRDSNFYNESCGYADVLVGQDTPQIAGVPIFLNYAGATVEADLLQNSWGVYPSTIIGDFKNKLHVKAQFFKVIKNNRDKIVFEITKQTACTGDTDDLPQTDEIRYTIYKSCSDHTVLGGAIVDLNLGFLEIIDITTFPETFIIAVDSPIKSEIVDHTCVTPPPTLPASETVYKVIPPCGCFSMYARNAEDKEITITWDNIRIDKVQEYQASCAFKIPRVNDCKPTPYKKGIMAYWESTETYDDNKQLWDSSDIIIKPEDLNLLSGIDKEEFLQYYTNNLDSSGNYILDNADFRCQPIRHPKFPDNTVAPYIIDNINFQREATSIIFPLGVELDSNVIKTVINIAYTNKLITKKQKDKIQGYEILRGDNSISKSVIANGIAFDVYNYEKNGDRIHFSNFPFNDLGQNKYCLTQPKGSLIDHPFNSEKNYLYTFLSPDIFLTRNTIPDEVSLQGFVMGSTASEFTAVDEHSEWTVLGQKARRTSETLAIAEVTLEFIIKSGELLHNQWFVGGVGSVGGSIGGLIAAGVAIAGMAVSNAVTIGKYRYDWLKTFRDLGRTYNFANFQTASANYNKFLKADQYSNEYLRKLTIKKYLKDGDYTLVDENDGKQIKINNWLRETSAFLSTGEQYPFDYSAYTDYTNYDNNKKSAATSSNFVSSETECKENVKHQRNVASPYFTLKNYIPDQWGKVDSIKWLTTNNIFDLNEVTACKPIFGGTVVISRFSWRRKTPIFRKDAIGLADKLPFMYSRYDNIGYPRFYCNYELDDGDNMYKGFLGLPYPDINSETAFDCETGRDSMYYKPPSKFYTSVHGVVDFLVESEINCNFRYAKNSPKDNFYPQNQNLSSWLQQTNLPISEPNSFYYNSTYSFNVSNSPYKFLDKTYDKEVWRKRNLQKNAVTWSQREVNENDLTNPWLVYKPLDWYEFKTNNGELVDMHNIESNQFIARFENRLMLHNAIDVFSEKLTPQNRETGVAGMFYQRPLEFKSTDLGFMGTQHTDIVSTPYGHFWVDALRGKIFKLDENGKGLEIISEQIGNQPSNMKQWFREHLPMKILKQLPGLDIDNKYKGIGYNMWYDDRESRLFITKRDYILKNTECLSYDDELGTYYSCNQPTISCPEGFTYNTETEMCEKETTSPLLCPSGYTYNPEAQTCTLTTTIPAECEEDINFDVTSTNWGSLTTESTWESFFISLGATFATITNFSLIAGNVQFHVATDMQDLQLTTQNITVVTKVNVLSLISLDLRQNDIIVFDPEILSSNLEILRIDSNEIIDFNPTTPLPTSLKILSIGTNSIITFNPTVALPSGLQELYLNTNNIITFDPTIALPTSLQKLSITHNSIVTFSPTLALPNGLQELYLIANDIVTFNPTTPLPVGLLKLYLNGNEIATFNPTVALPINLILLWLNGNNIVTFNPTIPLPIGLQELDLGANNIIAFNPTSTTFASLNKLGLNNNNINTSSWNTATSWISAVPNGGILVANSNPDTVIGTNTQTLLLTKSWTITT